MPHLTQKIHPQLGPLVKLRIGVSNYRALALKSRGQVVPPDIDITALIDTGASNCCVDSTCIQQLGLTPTGSINIRTPSTGANAHPTYLYDIKVVLPHMAISKIYAALPVAGAPNLASQGIQMLLGRDVLAQCLLTYDGGAGICAIAF